MNIYNKGKFRIIEIPSSMPIETIKELDKVFSSAEEKEFILDLNKVTHIFSIGIRTMVHVYNKILEIKGSLYVVNANELVEKTIKSINLDKIIPIFKTFRDFERNRSIKKLSESKVFMDAKSSDDNKYTIVELKGFLHNHTCADNLIEFLESLKEYKNYYLFDFRNIDMLDSITLGILLDFFKKTISKKGKITITCPNTIVLECLKDLKINKFISITKTIEDAQKYLTKTL